MAIVERVPKNGFNKFHGYNYATEADIAQAVRAALAERHIMVLPNVESERTHEIATKNGTAQLCTMTVRFDICDGDSGEVLTVRTVGQGSDSTDKAAYKAMTGAMKYCDMKMFKIPTGDDPEAETEPHREVPPPQGLEGVRATMNTKPSPPRPPANPGICFPNYGNSKNQPVRGASEKDLRFYLGGAERTLADPGKARFHEQEARLAAAIKAELARQANP